MASLPRQSEALELEREAGRFMFRAVDAMMAAREKWREAGRQDLIDQLEPHYSAVCEMGRPPREAINR